MAGGEIEIREKPHDFLVNWYGDRLWNLPAHLTPMIVENLARTAFGKPDMTSEGLEVAAEYLAERAIMIENQSRVLPLQTSHGQCEVA